MFFNLENKYLIRNVYLPNLEVIVFTWLARRYLHPNAKVDRSLLLGNKH